MRALCQAGWLGVLLAGLCVTGCLPSGRGAADEMKESNFLTGKAREAALDYKGAMQAFEKALEVNPGNASAHFELALLCERNEADLPGAIYHYDRYLRLRPNAENTEIVKGRMLQCKQLLASVVSPVAPTPTMQRDLERLTAENRELKRQLDAWQTYYAASPPPTNTAGAPQHLSAPAASAPSSTTAPATTATAQTAPASRTTTAPTTRIHRVKEGETPIAIARNYGIKLEALMAANPGLDPKRMRVNQALTIPSP